MLKRGISLVLVLAIILLCLCSCDISSIKESSIYKYARSVKNYIQNQVSELFENTSEDNTKKNLSILIIGNSHSIDAFWLLYQAYMDQHPNTNLCIGILHYGGANIDEHVNFGETGKEVITYYKNDSGKWKTLKEVTSEYVLRDHPWDIIMMQPAKEDLSDPTLNKDGRDALAAIIHKYVKNPHEIMWHVSWPSPNDETFFSPDYIRQPPKGYKEKLTRLYGFDPVNQYSVQVNMTKEHALEDIMYSKAVCSGASIMHALLVQGFPQLELWRDYTHLSDYGRLMASYALVAQIAEEPIESVGIDVITVGWRHKQNRDQGQLEITQELKEGIIAAANYALESTWIIPDATT